MGSQITMQLLRYFILDLAILAASILPAAAGPADLPWVYSTYFGSESEDLGAGIAVDALGRATVTGFTSGTSFPTARPLDGPQHGVDAFVTRFDADGAATNFSFWFNALTLFAEDEGYSIALDAQGNAYVTGYTRSTDFCTVFGTVPGFSPTYFGETDAYVVKIRADGSGLDYCTFLGGSDWDVGRAIAVDDAGQVVVVGGTWSGDFPVTPGAVQPALADLRDTFVVQLDASGTALRYSTFLGGTGQEEGVGVQVGPAGAIHVTGWTNSTNFPVTAGVLGPVYGGSSDGFLYELDLAGHQLTYSTYLGGSGEDRPAGLVLDGLHPIIAGITRSPDFPTTPGALAVAPAGGQDAFVARVMPGGHALGFATYLGGSGDDWAWAVQLDRAGTVLVAGASASTDFPVTHGAVSAALRGELDATLVELTADGTHQVYGTYLGGSGSDQARGVAVDAGGDIVLTGSTTSEDFPTTPGALDTTYNGGGDIFVTRLRLEAVPPVEPQMYLPLLRRH
jgi:hypothetical protein